jgi:hypothetical protein
MPEKHKRDAEHLAAFINKVRTKQQNVVWPGPLQNGRSIDDFLWKGSSHPPLVQRLGAWLIGVWSFMVGLFVLAITLQAKLWVWTFLGIGCMLLGGRIIFNGFGGHRRP